MKLKGFQAAINDNVEHCNAICLNDGSFTHFDYDEFIIPCKSELHVWKIYKEEKIMAKEEEFKVGDEVTSGVRRFIILGTDIDGRYRLWCLNNGLTYNKIGSEYLKKTGESFPQLVELFKQMRGEQTYVNNNRKRNNTSK